MDRYKQLIGAKGERLALQFLRQKGYKIISKNFSCRFGEIDIIARQRKTTVFIEVKTRTSRNFGLPQEAVGREKTKHLLRCAQFYINNYANPEAEFRFDLVAIVLDKKPEVCLIKDIL